MRDFVSEWGPWITPTPAPTVRPMPAPAVEDAIVSRGDSSIAGTAGRWRDNTNGDTNVPRTLAAFRRTESEGVHPNNLGQRAMRACLRRAFGGGNARSGTCKPPADWGLVDANDEPAVVFESK
ncbi:MAG: hypothetical protein ACKOCT_22420 [Alphaproteobacteria bacterium]